MDLKMLNVKPLNPEATQDQESSEVTGAMHDGSSQSDIKVTYKLCDINGQMVEAWREMFKEYIPDRIQVYKGDIFKQGPAADAIVSPANSFGFMDGGIDMTYSMHFGWQLQERLQKVIREEYNGELMVGDAIIIPTFEGWINDGSVDWSKFNEGQPIKYLISAPTMRVPLDVSDTANAYIAFRSVILSVKKHNSTPGNDPIHTVLCPGLGTAVGRMPKIRCAYQMLRAYETFELNINEEMIHPESLATPSIDHLNMVQFGTEKGRTKLWKNTKAKFESSEWAKDRRDDKERISFSSYLPIIALDQINRRVFGTEKERKSRFADSKAKYVPSERTKDAKEDRERKEADFKTDENDALEKV
ncbi:hypothetical protein CHS0354_022943 [Potamilus streckersoni]|uniref:Macro domain-containing protein n=1 Tax=Potamilus streckersoni TaxID=2493646 RepID=A0AAE0S5Y5_9BIVA|nr:hypothetical protein CHS0354_022943 [Potamilus streckersoni]